VSFKRAARATKIAGSEVTSGPVFVLFSTKMQKKIAVPNELERQVVRKVAWRLMPLLCTCFVAAFIDRVNGKRSADPM
jgi:hypothetical protein